MVIVWLVAVAWILLDVRARAASAEAELDQLREELDVEAMLEGDGREALQRLAERFEAIDGRLASPLLAPLRIAPVSGRQLSALSHQATAAHAALEIAVDVTGDLTELVDEGLQPGPERVLAMRSIESVARAGREAFDTLELGPDEALLGPLGSSRQRIEQARLDVQDLLARAADVSAGLAVFFEGPTDFLLLAANNSQMQNGQGMFLSAGVLHVEDGRMDLEAMEPTAHLPRPAERVALEDDQAARWGWLDPNRDFRHLGLSHRFPETAETAAALWEAIGRPAVDGVMVVDPFVLRAIMQATGPIETSAGTLRAEIIVDYALYGQYLGYLTADGEDASFDEERRDQLEEVAVESLSALERIEDVEPAFVEDLAAAARGRHLLAWSIDPAIQKGWRAARIDGRIGPDAALLSIVNRSGNKLDWFLRSTAELELEPDADGTAATVRITIDNAAVAEGQPAYVVGPYPGSDLAAGEYLGLVTLNLPQGATGSRFDGIDTLAVAGADGPNRTIAAWVRIPPASSLDLVARFHLPAGTPDLRIEASGRGFATDWSWGDEEWTDAAAHTVELPTGR